MFQKVSLGFHIINMIRFDFLCIVGLIDSLVLLALKISYMYCLHINNHFPS